MSEVPPGWSRAGDKARPLVMSCAYERSPHLNAVIRLAQSLHHLWANCNTSLLNKAFGCDD